MTTEARAETTIHRSADDVWAAIQNFGDLSWVGGVEWVKLDGDQREIKMQGESFSVRQRLLYHDAVNRTYSFQLVTELDLESILGPGHVLRELQGTLAVSPRGDAESQVTFDVDTEDFVVAGVRDQYQRCIENLKTLLEGEPDARL